MEDKRLQELADKFLKGMATPEEEAELHRWWEEESNHGQEQIVVTERPETADSVRSRILANIGDEMEKESAPPVVPLRRRVSRWALVAASLVILLIVLAVISVFNRKENAPATRGELVVGAHVLPGGNKAYIHLPDNRIVSLDSAKQGLIQSEPGGSISKGDSDRLVFTTVPGAGKLSGYSTLFTPKGGQYEAVLQDGSLVWLNAASSLTVPSAFKSNRREVELSGEAYFEITPDSRKPFIVTVSPKGAPACEITVLGTHFDINSYSNEPEIKATLLEGTVRITSTATNRSEIVRAGQDGILTSDNDLQVVDDSNAEAAIAWKNGLFRFNNDTIETVMKQIARWYDVDVQYDGQVTGHFVTTLQRKAKLDEVLQTLQKTGKVHFKQEGRRILVSR